MSNTVAEGGLTCRERDPAHKWISVEQLDLVLSKHFNVVIPDEIIKKCRKRELVYKRQVCAHFYCFYTQYTLEEIADRFGYDDHTSVVHSRHVIKDLMDSDPRVKSEIEHIKQKLFSMPASMPKFDSTEVLISHYKEVYDLLSEIRRLQASYDESLSPLTKISLKRVNEKADKYLAEMGHRPKFESTKP